MEGDLEEEEAEAADPVVLAAAELVPCMACGCSPGGGKEVVVRS